jgi:hypothetical protein
MTERERRVVRDGVSVLAAHMLEHPGWLDVTESECYAAWNALAGTQSPGAFAETSPNAYQPKPNVST